MKNAKRILICCALVFATAFGTIYNIVPDTVSVFSNGEYQAPSIISFGGGHESRLGIASAYTQGSRAATPQNILKYDQPGVYSVSASLFGVPIKMVAVNILPNVKVIPCGDTIGVKLFTDGIMVVGVSDVVGEDGKKHCPLKDAGIREGDIIYNINNTRIKSSEDLSAAVEGCGGEPIQISIIRDNGTQELSASPTKSAVDGLYKLGVWVRDSTAGIGTLTFMTEDKKLFAALGHGITDVDTGKIMSVGNGNVLKANISSIIKGEKGKPGELKGSFGAVDSVFGSILENSELGIYGVANGKNINLAHEPVPIALRDEVKEGSAYILCNVNNDVVEKYDIEIQKVMTQSQEKSKGMVVRITDKRLLDQTGGIVQGMSGSPIIQNGKIVGAITHVFVNDPTRGYGIFIEWMLKNANELIHNSREL